MDIFSATNLARLWSEWEVRVLVLTSLFIQILLISTVGIKNRASKMMGFRFLIWLCYLLADWVATFALGVLAKNLLIKKDEDDDELKVLWAPFLLLHLGGPDNITAFSLEDNELWLRHLVGLLFQVGTAFYIFFSSFLHHQREYKLLVVTILMFMGGIIKYVERTLALKNASRDNFRKSMVTNPDPGPDYPKGVKAYYQIDRLMLEPDMPPSSHDSPPSSHDSPPSSHDSPPSSHDSPPSSHDTETHSIDTHLEYRGEIELIWRACYFFEKLKRLIVDLILTYEDALISRSLFTQLSWEEAYKVIEIELGFLYEVLYTKAAVVRSLKGWIFRFTSVSSIIVASIIFFAFIDHDDDEIDVTITFILLSGAIVLEFWSLTRLIFADWTLVWMRRKKINPSVTRFVLRCLSYRRRSRWPKYSMAQYNLISFCLKDMQQPRPLLFGWGNKIMNLINVKDQFDNYWYRSYKNISEELKEFIFEDIKGKVENLSEAESYDNFKLGRGELALKKINNSDEELDNSISKAEFDESILLWHIATDICYYMDMDAVPPKSVQSNQGISRDISNYMLYILVSRPFMLSVGIGQIRFGDTCAEAKRFFKDSSEKEACTSLYEEDTEIPPKLVKGDKSQSVLFAAVRVAKSLLKQETDLEKRWEFISLVWLEMLCYAAFECRGHYHAQRLAAGGELLTLVSCLMGHLGIGHQYRVFVGEKERRQQQDLEQLQPLLERMLEQERLERKLKELEVLEQRQQQQLQLLREQQQQLREQQQLLREQQQVLREQPWVLVQELEAPQWQQLKEELEAPQWQLLKEELQRLKEVLLRLKQEQQLQLKQLRRQQSWVSMHELEEPHEELEESQWELNWLKEELQQRDKKLQLLKEELQRWDKELQRWNKELQRRNKERRRQRRQPQME